MADFSDVVEQLQRNNRSEAGRDSRHTAMLNQLNETMKTIEATGTRQEEKEEVTNAIIEDLKRQVQEEKKILQDNGKLVQGSNKLNKLMLRQSEEELKEKVRQADTPSERKEAEKELKSFQDKQVGRLGAIVDGFKGIGKFIKGIGDKKIPGVGLTLGTIAKLALIPALIAFLDSDLWRNLKKVIIDPSWESIGNLFKEYPLELGLLTAAIGLWAIGPIGVAVAAVGTALTASLGLFDKLAGNKPGTAQKGIASWLSGGGWKKIIKFGGVAGLIAGLGLAAFNGWQKWQELSEKEGIKKADKYRMTFSAFLDSITFGFIGFDKIDAYIKEEMEKQKKYNEALAKSRTERNEQFKKLFEDTKIFAKRLDNYINESAANFGAYLNRMTDSLMGKLPKIDPAFAENFAKKWDQLSNALSPTRIMNTIGDAIEKRPMEGLLGGTVKSLLLSIFGTTAATEARLAMERTKALYAPQGTGAENSPHFVPGLASAGYGGSTGMMAYGNRNDPQFGFALQAIQERERFLTESTLRREGRMQLGSYVSDAMGGVQVAAATSYTSNSTTRITNTISNPDNVIEKFNNSGAF